jgi:hypothetical protein
MEAPEERRCDARNRSPGLSAGGATLTTYGNQVPLVKLAGRYFSPRVCLAAQLARFALRSALMLSRNAEQTFSIPQNSPRSELGTSPPPLTALAI